MLSAEFLRLPFYDQLWDERLKDLMTFKAEFGHCNVPQTHSRNNKHLSLGRWCSDIRQCHKAIIEQGGIPKIKLSNADIQRRLENAGFEWNLCKKFDNHFKDLMAFKAKFGHCNVPCTQSSNNKHTSLGRWCSDMRFFYKTIKDGGIPLSYSINYQKLTFSVLRKLVLSGVSND